MSEEHPPLPGSVPLEVPKPSEARRLHLAFQSVFGQPGKASRTSDQRLVLKHLHKVGCLNAPIFTAVPGQSMDVVAAAHRDGARTVILIIERQLELARQDPEGDEPRKKPKVKR